MVKNEDYIKMLECNKVLRDNINVYKEAFVMYYGEDKRSFIEEQFSKVLLIGAVSPEAMKSFFRKIKDNKSKEIFDRIISNSSSFDKELLFNDYSLEFSSLHPINNYVKFMNMYKLGSNGRKQLFIDNGYNVISSYFKNMSKDEYMEMINSGKLSIKYQNIPDIFKESFNYFLDLNNADEEYIKHFNDCSNLFKKIDPNINLENISSYINSSKFDELNRILNLYIEGLNEYKEYMSKYSLYERTIEENDEMLRDMKDKAVRDLIKNNIDLVPDFAKKDAMDYAEEKKNYFDFDINNYIFKQISCIEAFSSESEKKLNDGEASKWVKESIIRDRIKYFKVMNIDLGDDYQLYVDSKDAKKIWPSVSRIDKFIKDKELSYKKVESTFFESINENKAFRKEIEELHFLDKDDSFNSNLYESVAFINPNLVMRDFGYELYSLLVLNIYKVNAGDIDHTICHELNHLFELQLQEVEDNSYRLICGWDPVEGNINQETKSSDVGNSKTKRPYELFNEIINELIAQDISKIMQDNDMYVFDSKEEAKYSHTTSYEHSIFLIKDFYNEFKNEIIESRSNGNIEIIWNKVGKDNFDELNSLFDIYFKNFSGMKIYSLYSSLKKNEDNEMTRIYYELINRRDIIMTRMREYNMDNSEKHGFNR